MIGKTNTDITKSIGFCDETNKKLVDLAEKPKKKLKKKIKNFVYIDTKDTQCDFNIYRNLKQFGSDVYSGELLLDEAKDEQNKMLVLINN